MTAAAQGPLGKLTLALEESFNRSDQGWMDIQNRDIEFHCWQLVDLSPHPDHST